MANVRDSDTSLWLHNKLGTSNDSWTGGSICSQLNAEVLRNIKDCFPDLQTQVKLKLLLSFFHIPRRNVEEVCLLYMHMYVYTHTRTFALQERIIELW
jgi:negative elongation factor A